MNASEALKSLMDSALVVHAVEVNELREQIRALHENQMLMRAAVMDPEFNDKRPGPWQEIRERIEALEAVAVWAQAYVKKSQSKGASEALELLAELDATYHRSSA